MVAEKSKLPTKKLKKLEVALVYLFGSKALKAETPLSDIDMGIVFLDPHFLENPKATRKRYNELYNILAPIYPPTFKKELDLVFLPQTPIAFQYEVIRAGRVLYEVSPEFRVSYEEKVVNEYLDFEPVLNYFDKVLLERLGWLKFP